MLQKMQAGEGRERGKKARSDCSGKKRERERGAESERGR